MKHLYRYWPVIVLLWLSNNTVAQPIFSNQKQRVISVCNWLYYDSSVAQKDSVRFTYSGNRGSIFYAPDFTSSFDPVFGSGFMNYDYGNIYYSYLPAADLPDPVKDLRSIHIAYDTLHRYVMVYQIPQQSYTMTQTMSTMAFRDTLPVSMDDEPIHTRVEYDGYGRPVSVIMDNERTSFVNDFVRQVLYGTDNKIVTDTIAEKNVGNSLAYIYDNNGRVANITQHEYIVPSGVEAVSQTALGYNAHGKICWQVSSGLNAYQQWDTILTKAFNYDSQDRIISMYTNDSIQLTIHYNDKNEADSVTRYFYGDWAIGSLDYCNKTVFFYNSFHNPDSAITYSFDKCQSSGMLLDRTYYRYETYFADTLANRDEVVLFPNPAHDHINIKWNKIFPTMPVNIDVYNSMGQLASRTTITKPRYTDEINIAGYAPGVYFLRIVSSEKKQLYIGRFVIDR